MLEYLEINKSIFFP